MQQDAGRIFILPQKCRPNVYLMKRLALLAVLTVSLIAALTSCEKKSCYQCTTTVTVTVENTDPVLTTAVKDYCDITDDRAREIEEAGSQTTTTTYNGASVTTVTATVCK